jgi:biopolymer transport protein ExbB/TolQ
VTSAAAALAQSGDFTITALFINADPVVKAVIVTLGLVSVASWAIILEKAVRLAGLRRDVRRLEEAARGGCADPRSNLSRTLAAAAAHENGGPGGEDRNELRGRLERAMRQAIRTELQRIETGLPFLATTGSAAPFVGLFGTVWGIMHSFTAIAQSKDTSLAIVAPGIAEALFATALGLAAAIPAVVAYNQIAVALGRAASRANAAATTLARAFARPDALPSRSPEAA